jgi:putative heme transporter
MGSADPTDRKRGDELDSMLTASAAQPELDADTDEDDDYEPSFFENPKRLAQSGLLILVLVVGIYVLLPKILEDQDASARLDDADPVWIVVAVGFAGLMFAAYVALFRGVVGEQVSLRWKDSYDITMAGLAATRLFSAGGAGGIVLTYWALRKAGMPRKETASRMVAFLVLLYAVYMATLVINGILMRTGVFSVPAPPGLTVVPAAIAGGVILTFLLMALVPGDLERRFSSASQESFWDRLLRRLATVPSTAAVGTREALAFVREPSRGGLAVVGAIGFWAAQVGILWASFKAFGVSVPLAVVVQAFFIGMVANLIPLPGGVGGVDAGLLGAFALFGVSHMFAPVLLYRVLAFWLPIPPGIVAFLQLRKTVQRWEQERKVPQARGVAEPLPGSAITS